MNKATTIILKTADTRKKFLQVAKSLIPGAAAGATATMAVMPLDTITDTQKQWRNTKDEPGLNRIGRSFSATTKELYDPKERKGADKGIAPFYTGAGGKIMKVAPSMAITYAFAKYLENKLGVHK
jgi:hypothetical protein